MRDLPGIAWILGIFVPIGVALLIYGILGVKEVPAVENVWTHVESLRSSLQNREVQMSPGEREVRSNSVFDLQIHRLNQDAAIPFARYVIRFRPQAAESKLPLWMGGGVDIGLVDAAPESRVGELRLVSIRTIAKGTSDVR